MPRSNHFRDPRLLSGLALLLLTVGLDQVTKVAARDLLPSQALTYFGDLFRLQRAENPGAFLSLGAGLSEQARFWVFTVGVSISVLGALWVLAKKKDLDRATAVALTLVMAGGIGNQIDRALKGTVTDFMNMGVGGLRTGIFNVADIAIMVGVGILLLASVRSSQIIETKNKTAG